MKFTAYLKDIRVDHERGEVVCQLHSSDKRIFELLADSFDSEINIDHPDYPCIWYEFSVDMAG